MKKAYKIIKLALFLVLGALILVFNKDLMAEEGEYLNIIVGFTMLYYGIEGGIMILVKKELKHDKIKFLNSMINILLGLGVIFLIEKNTNELVILSVIWSVWAIMREGEEICEKVIEDFKHSPVTSILNLIESIVVVYFSIELIMNPGEHHAHVHLILLGFELILEVIWEYIADFEKLIHSLIKEKKAAK